jgi:Tfp pilus assembly protein PilX
MRGFTLLPVVLAMSVIAAIAFLLNRDNGLNARMITQQADVERARYAAEAGLQAANFVVQGAGCNGIYPTSGAAVTSSNFAGAGYSAYSSAASGSPVTLVSTGSYNGASVTLTRPNVHVYRPMQTTVVQPGSSSGQDTHLHSDFPHRNYGAEQIIRLYTGKYQPLLKFDLGGLSAGTRVVPWFDTGTGALKPGATLSLYQTQGGASSPASVNVHLITRSWVEGTQFGDSPASGATWSTYDGVNPWSSPGVGYASVPVASNAHTTNQGWKDWDVTDAVAGWLSGVYPNEGLWLVDSGGSIGDTYYQSSEGGNATRRPKLTLNYLQPCGSAGTAYIELAADGSLKSNEQTHNFGGALVMEVNSGSPERRVLVRFDVSSIPPGSVVKSAVLRLYCSNISSATNNAKTIRAYYVMEAWVEGTMNGGTGTANGATWNTRNGINNWSGGGSSAGGYAYWDYVLATGREEASGVLPLPGAFRQGWVSFDLTMMVQSWVDNAYPNYGILLRGHSTSDVIEFDSRDSTAGRTPQLVVVYQ